MCLFPNLPSLTLNSWNVIRYFIYNLELSSLYCQRVTCNFLSMPGAQAAPGHQQRLGLVTLENCSGWHLFLKEFLLRPLDISVWVNGWVFTSESITGLATLDICDKDYIIIDLPFSSVGCPESELHLWFFCLPGGCFTRPW